MVQNCGLMLVMLWVDVDEMRSWWPANCVVRKCATFDCDALHCDGSARGLLAVSLLPIAGWLEMLLPEGGGAPLGLACLACFARFG